MLFKRKQKRWGQAKPLLGERFEVSFGLVQACKALDTKRIISTHMGSFLHEGPHGPFYKGAVLYWAPKKGP